MGSIPIVALSPSPWNHVGFCFSYYHNSRIWLGALTSSELMYLPAELLLLL